MFAEEETGGDCGAEDRGVLNEAEREDGGQRHREGFGEFCIVSHQAWEPLQQERNRREETEEAAGEENEEEGPVEPAGVRRRGRHAEDCWELAG